MFCEVYVSNIGLVHSGNVLKAARKHFKEYVELSKAGYGRAAGESVNFLIDDVMHDEYYPERGLSFRNWNRQLKTILKKEYGIGLTDTCLEDRKGHWMRTITPYEFAEAHARSYGLKRIIFGKEPA